MVLQIRCQRCAHVKCNSGVNVREVIRDLRGKREIILSYLILRDVLEGEV